MIISSLQVLVNQAKNNCSAQIYRACIKKIKWDSFRFWKNFLIQAMIIIDKFTKKNDECVW